MQLRVSTYNIHAIIYNYNTYNTFHGLPYAPMQVNRWKTHNAIVVSILRQTVNPFGLTTNADKLKYVYIVYGLSSVTV